MVKKEVKKEPKRIWFDEEVMESIEVNTKGSKDIILIRDKEGMLWIGIRNQYGNGFRFIPMDSVIGLIWGKYGMMNVEELENVEYVQDKKIVLKVK